jgi:predicted histidine transporter YuiF (NhaC family)
MAETQYIKMLLQLDQISKLHNILASVFTWILLAGYIVFPATFNNIQKDKDLDEKANGELQKQALDAVSRIFFVPKGIC